MKPWSVYVTLHPSLSSKSDPQIVLQFHEKHGKKPPSYLFNLQTSFLRQQPSYLSRISQWTGMSTLCCFHFLLPVMTDTLRPAISFPLCRHSLEKRLCLGQFGSQMDPKHFSLWMFYGFTCKMVALEIKIIIDTPLINIQHSEIMSMDLYVKHLSDQNSKSKDCHFRLTFEICIYQCCGLLSEVGASLNNTI